MKKQELKAMLSRFRNEKREAYAGDLKKTVEAYAKVQDQHAKECKKIGCYAAYHIVWNAKLQMPPMSVVDGFRNYPNLKSFRIYNNLKCA